jgi:hypothetical protein
MRPIPAQERSVASSDCRAILRLSPQRTILIILLDTSDPFSGTGQTRTFDVMDRPQLSGRSAHPISSMP